MKPLLLSFAFLVTISYSFCQYADLGTGSLKNKVWWFNWDGFNVVNGVSRVFNTADGLQVNITFTNVSGRAPVPFVMQTWSGAVLHNLYNFSNSSIRPALYNNATAQNSFFRLTVNVTRNGLPTKFTFVAADAEASLTERTTITTNGTAWKSIDFFRNSSQSTNPLLGCNTNIATIVETYGGTAGTGQNPVIATESSTGNLQLDVSLDKTGVDGGMAVAFGIFSPIDRGDLPATYGFAQHQLNYIYNNSCSFNTPFPSITQINTLHLGLVPGDADALESLNDNAFGVDEDAIVSFPQYQNTGIYSITLPLVNLTASVAYLSGWFDFNKNGFFDANELTSVTVPANSNSVSLTWTGLPTNLIQSANDAFRFRIASTQSEANSTTGYASNGEIEDYFVPSISTSCLLTLSVNGVTNICEGGSTQLTVTGATNYQWSPTAGLSSTSISNPFASPTVTTIYTVTGNDVGGCSSSTNVTVTVTPKPTLTATPSSANICSQDSVQLNVAGASNISWSPATGLSNATVANPKASPNVNTTYTVTGYNVVGCTNTATVTVSVLPKPILNISPSSVTRCQFDSVQLNVTGASNISWSPATGLSNATVANPKAAPNISTVYTATGFNNPGCSVTATLNFTVLPAPSLSINSAATICKDSVLQLNANASTASTFTWLPTTHLSSAVIANPLASPTTTTKYAVTATALNGCSKTDSVLITVLEKPFLQLRTDTSVCLNTPLAITANTSGANSFSWQPTTNLSNAFIVNPIVTPQQPIQYVVTAGNGVCTTKDTFNLGVLPLPTITKSLDTAICKTGRAVLTATTSSGNFSWSPSVGVISSNINSLTVSPDTTRYYYINATSLNTCTQKDSIKVTVNPKPNIGVTPSTANLCIGDSIFLSATGGDTYFWFNGTGIVNAVASSTFIKPTLSATYKVAINNINCKSTDTLSVPVLLNPVPNTSISKSNDINCSIASATITANGGATYLWDVFAGITNVTSASQIVSPTQTTVYKVKITNAAGCSKYDSVKVLVTTTGAANNKYLLPNAFTPNNDGLNDCFGLKLWGAITELDFKVYNRFGQIVFQTTNPSACWDGKQNGIDADLGTYVYQIKAKTICNGEVYRKGTIVLLR